MTSHITILWNEVENVSKEKYKSIKVKEGVYKDLKRMGKGIGEAVEILVEAQKESVEKKIEDVKGLGSDIAEIMLEHGIFDIKFKGAGVQDIEENGDVVTIRGFVNVEIANEEARAKLIEVLEGKEEEGEEESEK